MSVAPSGRGRSAALAEAVDPRRPGIAFRRSRRTTHAHAGRAAHGGTQGESGRRWRLGRGEPQRCRGRGLTPETREAALFEALGVDAEPGAVPQQDLRPFPRAIGEHEEVARQRIAPEVIQHERIEPVEPFAHVHGSAVSVDGDLACGADHARSRSTVTSPARSSPSMRKPCGVTTTGFLVDVIVVTVAGATAT